MRFTGEPDARGRDCPLHHVPARGVALASPGLPRRAYFADSEIGRSGGSHSGRLCTYLFRRVFFRRMGRVSSPHIYSPTICALPAHDRPTIPITRLTQLPRVPTWERQLNSDAEGEQSDASTSGRRLDPIVPWQILVPKVPWTLVRASPPLQPTQFPHHGFLAIRPSLSSVETARSLTFAFCSKHNASPRFPIPSDVTQTIPPSRPPRSRPRRTAPSSAP